MLIFLKAMARMLLESLQARMIGKVRPNNAVTHTDATRFVGVAPEAELYIYKVFTASVCISAAVSEQILMIE